MQVFDIVSTHSRPKAAGFNRLFHWIHTRVSTHSRPKAAGIAFDFPCMNPVFQHTAARRRLGAGRKIFIHGIPVSTHSRPKAAGGSAFFCHRQYCRFNTQPPEGGWAIIKYLISLGIVSTHSRPKAAGFPPFSIALITDVSTHSRPKAAGRRKTQCKAGKRFQHTAARRRLVVINQADSRVLLVSTHSRPKAAGRYFRFMQDTQPRVSTHSRPKAAGRSSRQCLTDGWFQHTAARRRLVRCLGRMPRVF